MSLDTLVAQDALFHSAKFHPYIPYPSPTVIHTHVNSTYTPIWSNTAPLKPPTLATTNILSCIHAFETLLKNID